MLTFSATQSSFWYGSSMVSSSGIMLCSIHVQADSIRLSDSATAICRHGVFTSRWNRIRNGGCLVSKLYAWGLSAELIRNQSLTYTLAIVVKRLLKMGLPGACDFWSKKLSTWRTVVQNGVKVMSVGEGKVKTYTSEPNEVSVSQKGVREERRVHCAGQKQHVAVRVVWPLSRTRKLSLSCTDPTFVTLPEYLSAVAAV